MKKKNALLLTLMLLLGAVSTMADQKYAGHDPKSFDTYDKPQNLDDSKIVYIYNVGAKKFLTKGGNWGTQLWLGDSAIPFSLFQIGIGDTNKYYIYSNDGYVGLVTSKNTSLLYDQNNVFVDKNLYINETSMNDATFPCTYTAVPESKAGVKNAYTIQVGGRYLIANGPKVQAEADFGTDDKNDNAYAYWIFVTKQDLLDEFEKAEATDATPVDCSFIISSPGFWRQSGDLSDWKDGNSKSLSLGNTLCRPTKGDKIYRYSAHNYPYYYFNSFSRGESITMKDNETFKEKTWNKTDSTTQGTLSTYYVGNGYANETKLGYKDNSTTEHFDTLAQSQLYYGGDWTANIHGNAQGVIYQEKQVTLRAGYYMVKCQGFSTDGSGYLFAMASDSEYDNVKPYFPFEQSESGKYVAFPTVSTRPATYVQAAKLLNNNTGYEKSVIVKVEKGQWLIFGAFVDASEARSTAWTCIDNFSMQYLGNSNKMLILDEDQESIDYINAQIDEDNNQTLYLKRSLIGGKWNSLVLPVNLSSGQIKGAFGGDQVMLSKLSRTENDGQQIIFEPVSLDSNDKAIEKGQLYIIKPAEDMPTFQKEVSTTLTINGEEKTITVGGDTDENGYYTINMVTHNTEVKNAQVENVMVPSFHDNGISHCGTYVKFGSAENPAIPAETYILSNGKWYYNKVAVNKVRGFRGWIKTGANVNASVVINGVEENVTAIDGLTADEPTVLMQVRGTYTLSGQKVSDAETTTGLKKGIYIVGGRKVVVK